MRDQEIPVHGVKSTTKGCRLEGQDAGYSEDPRYRPVSQDQKGMLGVAS